MSRSLSYRRVVARQLMCDSSTIVEGRIIHGSGRGFKWLDIPYLGRNIPHLSSESWLHGISRSSRCIFTQPACWLNPHLIGCRVIIASLWSSSELAWGLQRIGKEMFKSDDCTIVEWLLQYLINQSIRCRFFTKNIVRPSQKISWDKPDHKLLF